MQTTKLNRQSILPLTCSRSGSCCYGKAVMLNPWELFNLSQEKNMTAKEFRDLYCEFGGIQLVFNGTPNHKGQKSCSQYLPNKGCSIHSGRPLACRLYPLGRQIQSNAAMYIYEGKKFPCLKDCSEVLELPQMTVSEYLKGQQAEPLEKAQDEYLGIMQNIADIAFELLLDSGLAQSGDTKTLSTWRVIGKASSEKLVQRIGQEWLDCLMIPSIIHETENPTIFAQNHNTMLLNKAQENFGAIETFKEAHEGSILLNAVSIYLGKSLGVDTKGISEHWIATAKSHGALE